MLPQTAVPVDGGEARQVLGLIESLEDLDDVQAVYANFDTFAPSPCSRSTSCA